jgi:hypothetical protein
MRPPKTHTASRISSLMLLTLYVVGCTSEEQIQNGWENEYLGATEGLLFYPDNYANYWVYTFDPGKWKGIGLRISGKLPNSRYMSLNLYLHETRRSLGSVIDTKLILDDRSEYTVEFLPEGSQAEVPNTLFFDERGGRQSVFLRYYDPSEDPYGGVELPRVTAFDVETRAVIERPHVRINLLSSKLIPIVFTKLLAFRHARSFVFAGEDKELFAFRHSGQGYFPNYDNDYLLVPIKKDTHEVGILRFRPPTYARDRSDTSAEVRYWSVSLGTLDTKSPSTLRDRDVLVADDGFVYLLVGERIDSSDKTPYNLIRWNVPGKKAVLLYRNLLSSPGFEHAIGQVPVAREEPGFTNRVYELLGEFAPKGMVISAEQFRVSGFEALRETAATE